MTICVYSLSYQQDKSYEYLDHIDIVLIITTTLKEKTAHGFVSVFLVLLLVCMSEVMLLIYDLTVIAKDRINMREKNTNIDKVCVFRSLCLC